jgi:hypothetical protein
MKNKGSLISYSKDKCIRERRERDLLVLVSESKSERARIREK